MDSFELPSNISSIATANFKADVDIDLTNKGALPTGGRGVMASSTGRPRPFTDTLYFEVYVKDFAKNKSNVIKTSDPLLFITP
jgi:hypothetical protein